MAGVSIEETLELWASSLRAVKARMRPAQANVSLRSAIGREESRGAHAREDFPKRDDMNWLKHTLAWHGDDDEVRLAYREVHMQPLSNDVASIAPKERVY